MLSHPFPTIFSLFFASANIIKKYQKTLQTIPDRQKAEQEAYRKRKVEITINYIQCSLKESPLCQGYHFYSARDVYLFICCVFFAPTLFSIFFFHLFFSSVCIRKMGKWKTCTTSKQPGKLVKNSWKRKNTFQPLFVWFANVSLPKRRVNWVGGFFWWSFWFGIFAGILGLYFKESLDHFCDKNRQKFKLKIP